MTDLGDPQTNAIIHFENCLNYGMGDLETMLAGIRYRLQYRGKKLDANYPPPGYRSSLLRDYLKSEYGARRTTLWGATALRGRMKPETKGHIITFLELVNAIDESELQNTLDACGKLYARKVNEENEAFVLPANSVAQTQLITALTISGTVGKVQQGLVYAMLLLEKQLSEAQLDVHTKRTHAGDAQSGIKGDVSLESSGNPVVIFEVKGLTLDSGGVDKVLELHGRHHYPLFILAVGFRPSKLQDELNMLENTFAVRLIDFMLTKLAELAAQSKKTPDALIRELIDIYNVAFCEQVENDESIKVLIPD